MDSCFVFACVGTLNRAAREIQVMPRLMRLVGLEFPVVFYDSINFQIWDGYEKMGRPMM